MHCFAFRLASCVSLWGQKRGKERKRKKKTSARHARLTKERCLPFRPRNRTCQQQPWMGRTKSQQHPHFAHSRRRFSCQRSTRKSVVGDHVRSVCAFLRPHCWPPCIRPPSQQTSRFYPLQKRPIASQPNGLPWQESMLACLILELTPQYTHTRLDIMSAPLLSLLNCICLQSVARFFFAMQSCCWHRPHSTRRPSGRRTWEQRHSIHEMSSNYQRSAGDSACCPPLASFQ